jgi:hypothetical protein
MPGSPEKGTEKVLGAQNVSANCQKNYVSGEMHPSGPEGCNVARELV